MSGRDYNRVPKVIAFDRFYNEQLENEKFQIHSGLGLSISQHNLGAHGGNIWAKNLRNIAAKLLGACSTVN